MSDLPDYNMPIYISGVTIPSIPIDIVAQTVGNITVDIAAQSMGALSVNITGSVATLNVNIQSITAGVTFNVNITGSVTLNVSVTSSCELNIKTSGGANIVIDKLTQTAYTERRVTLANNGDTAVLHGLILTYKLGKCFPRGARGYIDTIEIYCANQDVNDHTFTINLAPFPGLGTLNTVTLIVSANSTPAWRSVEVRKMWNYDSLFVWVSGESDVYDKVGVDLNAPYDASESIDEINWIPGPYRLWVRVNLACQTVGDIPISGTVNTVEVPSVASRQTSSSVIVPNGTATDILTIYGAGTLLEATLAFNTTAPPSSNVIYLMQIWADGSLVYTKYNSSLTLSETATAGATSVGEFYQISTGTIMNVRIPIKFRCSIKIRAFHSTGGDVATQASMSLNLVK
ncbi:MAG: hypothetical protein K6T73_08175 [Candidatus Bathyarchaeota archaeon]|nr:hypothetical protein [Candidatus Bathyarchaeota archaeon]